MTCIDRQYRHIPHADIPAYEATGWRVVADFADCHHGEHGALMELLHRREGRGEAAESLGDVALRVVEDLARRTGRAK